MAPSTSADITRDRDGASSHTPAPWYITKDCGLEGEFCFHSIRSGVHALASTFAPDDEKQSEADARLIAAAPEMREALIDLLEIFEGQDFPALDKARAALAKAEGRDTP